MVGALKVFGSTFLQKGAKKATFYKKSQNKGAKKKKQNKKDMENTFGESTRQQKVARQIQKDISELFLRDCADIVKGVIVSVTAVRVSPDLEYARIYLSIFPFAKHEEIMARIEAESWRIRKLLGARMRNQLRVVPEITFFLDDSLEYIENIDNLLKK